MQDDRIRTDYASRTIACENECGYWLAAGPSVFAFPDCPHCAVPMVELPAHVATPDPMFKCDGCQQIVASCEECPGRPYCGCVQRRCSSCVARDRASLVAFHEHAIAK